MLALIIEFFRQWQIQSDAVLNELFAELRVFIRRAMRLELLLPDPLQPWLPRAFRASVELVLATMDALTDLLALAPFQAAARTILDRLVVDRKLRQKVMTLDKVALLVAKAIVEEGIRTAGAPMPSEWRVYKTSERMDKVANFFPEPTLKKFWRLMFGSLWGRIVKLILLVFSWGKLLGLVLLLWNWQKLLMNPNNWPKVFSAALRQDNPRESVIVTLQRRVGGVPP